MLNVNSIIAKMIENGNCKEEDRDVMTHGLSTAATLLWSCLTMIIISLICGLLAEGVVFFISFSAIRIYAGGYHCESKTHCYVLSTLIFTLVLFSTKLIPSDYFVSLSLCFLIIAIPIVLILAPLQTPKRSLDTEEIRYFKSKTKAHLMIELMFIGVLLLSGHSLLIYIVSVSIFLSAVALLCEIFRKKVQKIKLQDAK